MTATDMWFLVMVDNLDSPRTGLYWRGGSVERNGIQSATINSLRLLPVPGAQISAKNRFKPESAMRERPKW
jgi:hypothetical protein